MAFFNPLRTFNLHSYTVVNNCEDELLTPQKKALEELAKFFKDKPVGSIALISMPTGSGKSGVISCLPYFLGRRGLKPPPEDGAPPYGVPLHPFDRPVLVIAPDVEIANQLEKDLLVSPDARGENFLLKRKIIPDYALYAIPDGTKIDEARHILNAEFLQKNQVIIANAQKFLKDNWEEYLPDDKFRLVIIDEAHHHPARTWHRIIRKFKNHAMVVFLTATPFRGDGNGVLESGEGETVYRLSLEDARQQGIIRRTKWNEIHTLDEDRATIYALILERVKEIQERKDAENPLPDGVPHMAIAIAKETAYADDVAKIAEQFWGTSGTVIAYHSDVPNRRRKTMMEAIRNNQIKLVVVVGMLLEGFDKPPMSIAAIMTKIGSPVKFTQFIGRVQRVVRGQAVLESEDIVADIVTHTQFQQGENYRAFEAETLIPDD